MGQVEKDLGTLYRKWCGSDAVSVIRLPGSGSSRIYFRVEGKGGAVLGAYNADLRENRTFTGFSKHFRAEGLPVPEVLAEAPEKAIYLVSDLGDTTLYSLLSATRTPQDPFPAEIAALYRKVLDWLPVFQVKSGPGIDYSLCYPRAAFDRQSMMWDLNYFKYYFLKLAQVPFDEQSLENDFSRLCDLLSERDCDYFLYRDFQSRNIMILNGEPWFIDYQGGRRGALQYDVASLLVDAKAGIPEEARAILLGYYLDRLEQFIPVDREKFMARYYAFVLIRILQALGAYGFRGYYENKSHFLLSIPFALRNLQYLRDHKLIGFGLDALMDVVDEMIRRSDLYENIQNHSTLVVTVRSFSFKQPFPPDESGHGGGFVFDCRALPNPGRYDEFRELTGRDGPVADFLKNEPAVALFLKNCGALAGESIKAYSARKFEHLMVSFGCTGGQHRSVFCAEEFARLISEQYPVQVVVRHVEIEKREQKNRPL